VAKTILKDPRAPELPAESKQNQTKTQTKAEPVPDRRGNLKYEKVNS